MLPVNPQGVTMTADIVTEVVARFETRDAFQKAVEILRGAGFESSDLSVLDSHQSLEAAEDTATAWQDVLAGLVGEIQYVGPIATAGLIAVAAGPVGAAVAAGIAAGVSGWAVKDFLDEINAAPDTEAFAKALEEGAVLLWVRADNLGKQDNASAILRDAGGHDVHTHRRAPYQNS